MRARGLRTLVRSATCPTLRIAPVRRLAFGGGLTIIVPSRNPILNTEPRFRFCAIADCHFGARTAFADQGVIEDINRLAPDYTLVLGDISGPPDTGGPDATRRAVALLRGLKMPWRNIIGNHDLEFEGLETDRDNILLWLREHRYKLPWHREDRGPLT
ncbi:MAG: metallophosphoesterase, partial [Verrucomicrobia bacterium]|nr:metallophosphoesterase [Verrucomicrobiota bacterium]